ncbi:MAG: hypothetical protein JW755_08185 [Candidatus Aminicenantes bacterium]|nr:hypothetical protein [Candidatus Aminicenantes bacterium]
MDGLPQNDISLKAKKNLIRRDLLFKSEEKLSLPLRNIFSPVHFRRTQVGTAVVEEERNQIPENKQPDQVNEKKEPVRPALNVRYLGYVRSDERIVALILFRGTAFAVEAGELLEEQLEVKEVTDKEIILTLGGFKPIKFAIEGET